MKIKYGNGKTEEGPGVSIELNGDEVATAIDAWLMAHNVCYKGARTITINGAICSNAKAQVDIDPSGFVIANGKKFSGNGAKT